MLFLVALGALLFAMAAPAVATAEGGTEAPPETTAPAADVPAPAVSIPDEPPAASNPEWTFRFLLPAAMLLGGLVVVGTIIAYFAKVTRHRYRVVE